MDQTTNPETILDIASAFMSSKLLFAASQFGLFEKIGTAGKTLEDLSAEMKLSKRRLRILADAMVALGFLTKKNDRYENSEEALSFLSGSESEGLRPFLLFWDQISYQKWTKVQEAFRGESIFGEFRFTEEEQHIFSAGIESITNSIARILPEVYDFSGHHAVLDLGGGTGTYLKSIVEQCPHLKATLCELPQVAGIAQKQLASHGEKIQVLACDLQKDPIPEGHDVVLMANVMHIFSPERNRKLLSSVRKRVPGNTKLLLIDFWTDATHTKPLVSALLAAEFLIASGQGDAYSVEEVSGWLSETGWTFLSHQTLSGPFSLIVAS